MRAENGELHIADICTPNGLVLEFQHSAIKSEERRAREEFYGNMIWIVDGTRLKRDAPRAEKEIRGWRKSKEGEINKLAFPDEGLPRAWIECRVPVIFDFDGLARRRVSQAEHERLPHDEWWEVCKANAVPDVLFCLLPNRFRGCAVYFNIKREKLPMIVKGEFKHLDWQEAFKQMEARERKSR